MHACLRPFCVVVLFLILGPYACASVPPGEPTPLRRLEGTAWGTTWSLIVEGNRELFESNGDLAEIVPRHLHAWGSVLSTYEAGSEIQQLNTMPVGESRQVSLLMERALYLSRELCRKSGGLFDPLLGGPMLAHGFEPSVRNAHADRATVGLARPLPGRLHCGGFDLAEGRFTRRSTDLLNLNAIAEGLVMQDIADDLRSRGVPRFLFELGGEVIAGDAPGQRPQGWWVGVEAAQSGNMRQSPPHVESLQTFSLERQALSTSGTYRNVRGTHSHLMDSTSGAPLLAGAKSASVICDRADTADGLATILAVANLDRAPALLGEFPHCEALIQSGDRLWHSENWPTGHAAPNR